MLTDTFERQIDYLRISITDRCNLRCAYCLPVGGIEWTPLADMLTSEEILHFVEAAAALGICKVRLTGGEPLVRPDVLDLIRTIKAIPGIQEVSLTTNGMLLARMAEALAHSGLDRVNVSLDTLDADKFKRITRYGNLERVWRGLDAAENAGLKPVKINAVIVRGFNDGELKDFVHLARNHAWHVRFIELMPVGNGGDWGSGFLPDPQRYFSVQEMMAALAGFNLNPSEPPVGNGPARVFRVPGSLGSVGFISPLGQHFCDRCNRLRLTVDGKLRPCLLVNTEISIREPFEGETLQDLILRAVHQKPRGHTLSQAVKQNDPNRVMCQIGG
jgi:cyclic pyranopterin phosphate synthase